MIDIIPKDTDDKDFIKMVEKVLSVGLNLYQPKDVFIIKVNHWFDFKWGGFSHKIFGALGVWRAPLRVPPFIPDCIVEESHYHKIRENYLQKNQYKLHIYQHSDENAQRKISHKSAIYVWFSGDTNNNSQGSLMVYCFAENTQNSWYVSFIKKAVWQIYKTSNISKTEINSMLENDILALIR